MVYIVNSSRMVRKKFYKQNKTKQNKTKQNKTKQNKTKQNNNNERTKTMEALTTMGNYTLQIWYDDYPDSPRDWDNIGTLYIPRPPRGYSMSDANANGNDAKTAPVKIPVYILDHSGLCISSAPFGDPWDSWRAGTYYVTADKIHAEYGDAADAIERARAVAKGELDTYAAYISGDVYRYDITDQRGDCIDSCAGFYGEKDVEYIKEMFRNFVEYQENNVDYPLFSGIKNVWQCCSTTTRDA